MGNVRTVVWGYGQCKDCGVGIGAMYGWCGVNCGNVTCKDGVVVIGVEYGWVGLNILAK